MSDPNEDNQLARFLVSAPLYRKTQIREADLECFAQSPFFYLSLPKTVKRECVSCGAIMTWDIAGNRTVQEDVLAEGTYRCRNCGDIFQVWIGWESLDNRKVRIFEKCGQYPKFKINPPKNLEKSLGEYVAFWRTGMTLRHHGYGLGALVYFRRIVEGMTKALLGMLADTMEPVATRCKQ